MTYDNAAQRTTTVDPVGTTAYSYDAASRLTRVINPYSERTTLQYDDDGRPTLVNLANGTNNQMLYDAIGEQVRVESVVNLVCWVNLTASQWYAMRTDGWYSLPVNNAALTIATYTYDPVGNRTSSVALNGDRVSWSYDPTTNAWTQKLPVSATGSPPGRDSPSLVWDGTTAILFGGGTGPTNLSDLWWYFP